MKLEEFATKWRAKAPKGTERALSQEHFRDVCRLVGHPTPSDDDSGIPFTFERHVKKIGAGDGYADVWKRGFFAVEYKRAGRSLTKAFEQLVLYQHDLENPPLLVTSDLLRFEIHTNFTGTARKTYAFGIDDLATDHKVTRDLTAVEVLNATFYEPTLLDPRAYRERLTLQASASVGAVMRSMTARGVNARQAAHFLMRVVFCLFAEDVGLLERDLCVKLLKRAAAHPERTQKYFAELFDAMRSGGEFWGTDIRHFNGSLFDSSDALALAENEIDALLQAAKLDWAEVEPSIFGTLFEQGLEEKTRSSRGAHYTNATDILRIVEPVVIEPLRAEWEAVKLEAEQLFGKKKTQDRARAIIVAFHERLGRVKVLDPACGSGNFLYVTLKRLLDLEHEVRAAGEAYGLGSFALPPLVHPRQMLGVEIEPFAHELASVVLWIGHIQWKRAHGGEYDTPVLQKLHNIECRDALLSPDGSEASWPTTEFIVGNPPFLGEKKQRTELGDEYVETLRGVYGDRVAGSSDLVGYFFEKARARIEAGETKRVGLIATNSIRQPGNRGVLTKIVETGGIFEAWPDAPWTQDGAAVRVSLVCFDDGTQKTRRLGSFVEGGKTQLATVTEIHPDLSGGMKLTDARRLPENAGRSFQGVKLNGPFFITAEQARAWLDLPNEDDVSNADVLRLYLDGDDITDNLKHRWVVDFGTRERAEAEKYAVPFAFVKEHVEPYRANKRRDAVRLRWWRYEEARPAMRTALAPLSRYLVTSEVAKHRAFVWATKDTVPSGSLVILAFEDDFTYGLLNSSIHTLWALHMGQRMGKGNDLRYTPTTCFDTFPFPTVSNEERGVVEKAARYVEVCRTHLRSGSEPLTLTGMYNALVDLKRGEVRNEGVRALAVAHERLDKAVATAYGWDWPLSQEEVLARLLALNLERSGG